MKKIIQTARAPSAIGVYSQAVRSGDTVYISGQIGLDPDTMTMIQGGFVAELKQALSNLKAIVEASGGSLADIVKLTVYLSDMDYFDQLNAVIADYFHAPYPARAAMAVKALPKNALVEVDAIMVL